MAAPFVDRRPFINSDGEAFLLRAAMDGDLDLVKDIVETLAKQMATEQQFFSLGKGYSAVLHCAACHGHLETCKYLVEELGGDVNMIAGEGPIEGMAFTLQVPSRPILDQFTTMLGLAAPTFTSRQGSDGYYISSVHVVLGAAASVPYLYYEAAGPTIADAEQSVSLIAIHALAAEYQVELQGINYPQVVVLRNQVNNLQERIHDCEVLCCELLGMLRECENERTLLENLTRRFFRRIMWLRQAVAALRRRGSGSGSDS